MLTASQPPHWTTISQRKRNEAYDRIPSEWRLPTSYTDRVGEHAVWNVLSVPRECGILSHMDIEITEKFDAVALVQAIATAKFTAEQVAIAFCKRAAIAQQLVGCHPTSPYREGCLLTSSLHQTQCLTETFFDQAIARARELDAYFQETGKVKGPLHGLPVSLKVCAISLRICWP
jgi:amidase